MLLAEVDKSAGELNEPLVKTMLRPAHLEPKVFQDIMRLVVMLFVPALEKPAIRRVVCDVALVRINLTAGLPGYELRNPLAVVHGVLILLAAQIMGKPRTSSSQGHLHTRPLPGEAEARAATSCPVP
jgi:hypothetical protein